MNINDISTLAANKKKPNKNDAFAILKDAIENGMTEASASSLYAFFLPSPTKAKVKEDAFKWVSLAQGINDMRRHIQYIHVEASWVVGTDGHRVHVSPNTESLSEGFYDASGAKIEWKEVFPDWKRLFPADFNNRKRVNPEDFKEGTHVIGKKDMRVMEVDGVVINEKYFKEMVAYKPDEVVCYIGRDDIIFEWEDGSKGKIMAIRQK